MSDSFNSIPDPKLPEHRLLRDAAEMPTLSPGFRDRVMVNVHQQVRSGRWADRLRVIASTAAALLLVTCVWTFRGNRPEETSRNDAVTPTAPTTALVPEMSTAPSSASHAAAPPVPIELQDERKRSGGGGNPKPRMNLNEMQQINQLIEHYQQRQNIVCGLLPFN
jgi:hypothetical protein